MRGHARLRERLSAVPGLTVMDGSVQDHESVAEWDPLKLAVEVCPETKCMLVQLAPAPWMNRSRAGMLVMKVPMNNQPKIRPVR